MQYSTLNLFEWCVFAGGMQEDLDKFAYACEQLQQDWSWGERDRTIADIEQVALCFLL